MTCVPLGSLSVQLQFIQFDHQRKSRGTFVLYRCNRVREPARSSSESERERARVLAHLSYSVRPIKISVTITIAPAITTTIAI